MWSWSHLLHSINFYKEALAHKWINYIASQNVISNFDAKLEKKDFSNSISISNEVIHSLPKAVMQQCDNLEIIDTEQNPNSFLDNLGILLFNNSYYTSSIRNLIASYYSIRNSYIEELLGEHSKDVLKRNIYCQAIKESTWPNELFLKAISNIFCIPVLLYQVDNKVEKEVILPYLLTRDCNNTYDINKTIAVMCYKNSQFYLLK